MKLSSSSFILRSGYRSVRACAREGALLVLVLRLPKKAQAVSLEVRRGSLLPLVDMIVLDIQQSGP